MERHLRRVDNRHRPERSGSSLVPVCACVLVCLATTANRATAQQLDTKQTEKKIDAYLAKKKRTGAAAIPKRKTVDAQKSTDTRPLFKLADVSLEGATAIPAEALAETYEDYIGKKVSKADLAAITEKISELYRDAGFHLSRAIIPPQDIKEGRIQVQVIEGKIKEIVLKGEGAEQSGVRPILEPVAAEHPSLLKTLERSLLLAHDVPGVHVKDTALDEIGVASGKFRLIVHLETWDIYSALGLDNRGTSDVGPLQGYTVSAFNSLLMPGDTLGIDLSTIPDTTQELGFGRLSYDVPLGINGTRLGAAASYNEIRPSDESRYLNTVTRTMSVEVNASRALLRRRKSSLWLMAAAGISDVSESDDLGTNYKDHIRTVSLTGNYELHDEYDGANYLTATVRNGADIFGASDKDDLQLSTDDGNPGFTKLNFDYTRYQKLSDMWSLNFSATGQWASTALLSSEEFYIGGVAFGRGYDGGELSGDKGLAGSLELRFDEEIKESYLKGYQLYGFIERGIVHDFRDGKDDVDALTSAGGGIRLFLANDLQAELEIALPLDYRSPENEERDPGFFFSLSKSFKLCPRRYRRMRCVVESP